MPAGSWAWRRTTPFSPPSGPTQWLFQGPPAESKLLAASKYWSGGGRQGNIHADYRAMLLIEGVEKIKKVMDATTGRLRDKLVRKGMSKVEVDAEMQRLEAGRGVAIAKRLRWRLRYLSDGAVIGQRSFVDEVFQQCRDQFGERRKDGARRMRGDAAGLTKESGLWSMRDLGVPGDQ